MGGGAFAPAGSAGDEHFPNRHFHAEFFVVLGAFSAGDAISGRLVLAGLDALLKLAARIDVKVIFDNVIQQLKQGRRDIIDSRGHAFIKVDGADERFEGLAEDGQALAAAAELFAAPNAQMLAKATIRAELRQRFRLDQGGAQLRQLAFIDSGELAKEQVGDDEIKHGIAEEFEPFVVARGACALVFIDE